jgi:hypothetical protein
MTNEQYNVEELISRNDLVAFAERAGAKFKKMGKEYRSHCPIHGGQNGTAFVVWDDGGKQKWRCYTDVCGFGDIIDFIKVWQKKNFVDAVRFLGGDTFFDPEEMKRLADERHQRAVREREAAQKIEEARRKELRSEEKHLFYHNNMTQFFVDEWLKRGLDESWQGFWNLGGCPDFVVNDTWHTPTLTIPIVDEQFEVLNIKHRLLNPPKPGDKYRPERPGLGKFPYFMAYPDLGYDKGDVYWILEGEIKAAVTATITPESGWQFIGVPGKSQYTELVGKLNGKNVIVVPDPDAGKETAEFCRAVNARYIRLPGKVDDMVVEHGYDGDWLRGIEKQARRLK